MWRNSPVKCPFYYVASTFPGGDVLPQSLCEDMCSRLGTGDILNSRLQWQWEPGCTLEQNCNEKNKVMQLKTFLWCGLICIYFLLSTFWLWQMIYTEHVGQLHLFLFNLPYLTNFLRQITPPSGILVQTENTLVKNTLMLSFASTSTPKSFSAGLLNSFLCTQYK